MDEELCKNAIYSNEYYDLILDYIGGYSMGAPECIQQVDDTYDIGFYRRERAPELNLQDYPYLTIPHCLTPMDMTALEVSGMIRLQNPAALDLQGQGVLIGFVDTGINYEHPAFRNVDGSTRILGIWDQTQMEGPPPNGMSYGAFYGEEEINAALQAEQPQSIVPERDESGHGTFLAGVACGSADAGAEFSGAAPLAQIAVVKCKQAKQYLRDYYFIPDGAECYQENDLVAAVFYLQKVQEELKRPLVICLAVGTSFGGHGGYSILSEYLQNVAASEGIGIVTGSGNEADKRHHYLGILEQENNLPVEINVGNNTRGFVMELWTELPNLLALSIASPTGQTVGPISLKRGIGEYVFVFEQTRVIFNYRVLVETTGAQLAFFQFERPGSGIWKIIPETLELGNGIFHIWLPMEEFLTGNVYFIRANPEYTVMEPGDTGAVVCAAYYNGKENSIAVSSGRGYTRDNRIKPDFAAPGINVTGINLKGQFVARSGSSIAVGITSGALALFMEWLDRHGVNLDASQMKNLLILGASRKTDMNYPNQEWGYGALNLYRTFEQIRRF